MNGSVKRRRLPRGWAIMLAGLAWMGFAGPAWAAPRERDVWYGFLADGQRYGYQHVTVRRLPDGNFQYVMEERMLLDLFGVQKQEIAAQTKLVVTPEYKPVALDGHSSSHAGKRTAKGSVEGGKFRVRLKRNALETVRTVDLGENTIFLACLTDWLQEPVRRDGGPWTFQVVDDNSFLASPSRAERKNSEDGSTVWNIDLGELGRGEMTFDRDGLLEKTRMVIPPLYAERCTEEQARAVSHRRLAGREVLSFPMNKPVRRPDRLTSLTVSLEWADVAWERLDFEDERQHVVKRSDEDNKHRAVLTIQRITPAPTSSASPLGEKQRAAYLAETRFIKPSDEAIRAKAREWTQGKADPIDAIRALSKEIGRYLQGGSLIVETLSGPEVLQCKQGKCSEHATLFASLARSLGIPTRIVLGLRMVGGQWMGHMWNEAYVGRWITVDTTVNEVGDSMALVKLVHSDTVLGTQPVRWELTKSLGVTIDDFQLSPGTTDSRYKTGIEGRVYTNTDFACRLTAPSDDWSIQDKSNNGPTVIRFKVPDKKVLIHFVAFSVPEAVGPTVIVTARRLRFQTLHKEFKVLQDEPYKAGAVSGRIFVFERATGGKEIGTTKTTEVVWKNGQSCYLLNIIADKSAHEKYLTKFKELLGSFQPLD